MPCSRRWPSACRSSRSIVRAGLREIVEHEQNGLLVAAGDVTGLAAALARLMGDPAERVRLGKTATGIAVALAPESVLGRWNELVVPVEKR